MATYLSDSARGAGVYHEGGAELKYRIANPAMPLVNWFYNVLHRGILHTYVRL